MTRVLLAISIILACHPGGQAQTVSKLDSAGGVFGIVLEQHMNRMPEQLSFVKRARGKVHYDAMPSGLKRGGIRFSRIRYFFYRDQLLGIELRTEDGAQSDSLLAAVQRLCGPGVQDGYAPHYTWHSQFFVGEYDQNLFTKVATFTLQSLMLQRLYENDLRQRLLEGE
jgi:hypothetical protein